MKYAVIAGAALALCAVAGSGLAAEHHQTKEPAYIHSAVDDTTRPEADRKRDADRHPGAVLTFAGIKPGMKVLELMPSGGYYTRLLCRVVGDSGHVYGVNFKFHMPPRPAGAAAGPPRARAARPAPAPLGCSNVDDTSQDASAVNLPSDVDVVWTTENYHDMHNPAIGADMKQLDMAVFNALKPGGEFIIEDHAAAAGHGTSDTNTLHRIDPASVREEVESVGFKFAGQSKVNANPSDDHTKRVFTLHDKTDRFLFKFRKPA
ncbi:MAG TPA: hypothetical protein VN660_01250 [Steroidobacteraceae bacterium]|nr:hypothetical protein [Steroidobacteraceae bacterium]